MCAIAKQNDLKSSIFKKLRLVKSRAREKDLGHKCVAIESDVDINLRTKMKILTCTFDLKKFPTIKKKTQSKITLF